MQMKKNRKKWVKSSQEEENHHPSQPSQHLQKKLKQMELEFEGVINVIEKKAEEKPTTKAEDIFKEDDKVPEDVTGDSVENKPTYSSQNWQGFEKGCKIPGCRNQKVLSFLRNIIREKQVERAGRIPEGIKKSL